MVGYAIAFTLAVRLGYAFRVNGGASPFWPAAGLALAALLLRPTRQWPAYVLIGLTGAALVKWRVEGASLAVVLTSAPFDLMESVIAATILRHRTDFDPALARVRDLLLIAGVVFFIATPLAALVGASRLVYAAPSISFFPVFQTWMLGDTLGILLFAPPVLATLRGGGSNEASGERTAPVALLAIASVLGLGVLALRNPSLAAYLASPVLCFAAFKYGLRFTSYLAMGLSTTAVVTSHFAASVPTATLTTLASLQAFGFVAVSMVLLAAALDEQRARTLDYVRVERSLRTAQKFEALGRLSSGIAHDFNNVLSAIMASAELVQLTSEPAKSHRLADEIIRAAERGEQLIKRLMAYGRRDDDRPVACAIAELVTREISMLERVLRGRGVIEVRIDDDTLVVLIDEATLSRMLLNLVTNSADASDDHAKITIRVHRHEIPGDDFGDRRPQTPLAPSVAPGVYACISVADEGHGMSEDVLGCMFEPFFTTKPEGEGTGLGLASAYRFVSAANGAIIAASAPGQGTTVRILLPLHGHR